MLVFDCVFDILQEETLTQIPADSIPGIQDVQTQMGSLSLVKTVLSFSVQMEKVLLVTGL